MRRKIVTLALQGGGSHGAFTWGVLDRLLEDDRLDFEGISGASAGAMNAVVFAHGFTTGGREGARAALADFWERVGATAASFAVLPEESSTPETIDAQARPTPVFKTFMSLARLFSPYELNPFDLNPLRDILTSQVDFDVLRDACQIKLFIAATRVSSGTLRLFRNKRLDADVLLASACIPTIHRAITIDGEDYWDGGLAANPPIFPLLHQCSASDVAVVLLHPWERTETPKTTEDIRHRLTEISFSSTFYTELQGLAIAKREAERSLFPFGRLERRLRRLNLHMIDANDLTSQLSVESRLNTHPAFLNAMRDEGRKRAGQWLAGNFHNVGSRSSISLTRFIH